MTISTTPPTYSLTSLTQPTIHIHTHTHTHTHIHACIHTYRPRQTAAASGERYEMAGSGGVGRYQMHAAPAAGADATIRRNGAHDTRCSAVSKAFLYVSKRHRRRVKGDLVRVKET